MKGKKTDISTVYKVMLSLFSTNSLTETAKLLKLPISTVQTIYNRNKDKEEFVILHKKKKAEFVEKAEKIIDKAMQRLEEALENKEERHAINQLSTVIRNAIR